MAKLGGKQCSDLLNFLF